jgi:hypothetical protein
MLSHCCRGGVLACGVLAWYNFYIKSKGDEKMKELMAKVLLTYYGLSFVLVAFGIWAPWTLVAGLIAGIVYMIFTR